MTIYSHDWPMTKPIQYSCSARGLCIIHTIHTIRLSCILGKNHNLLCIEKIYPNTRARYLLIYLCHTENINNNSPVLFSQTNTVYRYKIDSWGTCLHGTKSHAFYACTHSNLGGLLKLIKIAREKCDIRSQITKCSWKARDKHWLNYL